MQEGTKVMEGKNVLDEVEKYIKNLNEATGAWRIYKDYAIRAEQATEELAEAMRTSAELRKRLTNEEAMHREGEPEAPHVQGKASVSHNQAEEVRRQMQEKITEVKGKIVLEGVEEYRADMEKTREAANRARPAVQRLDKALRKLNESMKEFAELREKLF